MKNRMIRRSLMVFFTLCICQTGYAASSGEAHTLSQKSVPFRIQMTEKREVTEQEIHLYFVDGGEIPYVSLEEYMPFVGEVYADPDEGIAAVEYDIDADENGGLVTRRDNGAMMGIDTDTGTLVFDDYDAFVMKPGSATLMTMVTPFAEGSSGVGSLFQDTGWSYNRAGDFLIMDLGEYGIEPIAQDGAVYLPLQTVNDVLVALNYVQVVYNGQEVLACGYGTKLLDDMYKAPAGEMSEELSHFNYSELSFFLDHFYGLAKEHGIEHFLNYFVNTGLAIDLSGTDPQAFDLALQRLIGLHLDDSHSAFQSPSYLSGEDYKEALELELSAGASSTFLGTAALTWKMDREKYYPQLPAMDMESESPYLYEEVGDTAIITFDAFTVNKTNYRSDADLEHPQDTIELIAYAQQQITRENSPIKNVVMDLSCNGGGQAEAAVFAISWFMGTAQIALRDTLTGAQSVCMYYADGNLDGEFSTFDDSLPEEINRYCLISPFSFSCGNLVPAAFKDFPGITLLGRTTGGGACVVLPATTASGAAFQISGIMQIGVLKNGSFYSADTGVEPDFTLSKGETFYDREKLVSYIHELP